MSILEHVQLKNVFRYFEEISQIPHGSYHTEAIGAYLVQFAQDHGFWHKKDEAGNVIIVKEASKGYEASETVICRGIWIWSAKKKRTPRLIWKKKA